MSTSASPQSEGPAWRRLIRSVVPAGLRELVREMGGLTPAQRVQYVRTRFAPAGPDLPRAARGDRARVVFVCYGNIFRSPMAEALYVAELRRRGRETDTVSSAGLSATDGRPAAAHGVDVARAMGVALEAHRARRLTDAIVEDTDLVVVMDHINVAVLRDRFPLARDRVVLLGAFDPEAARLGAVIPDPYGRPRDEVVACYRRIERAVQGLAARMVDAPDSNMRTYDGGDAR